VRGKYDAYVDVVAQELKGESGSLATNVAVCYVRLDAQNTTRIRVHDSIGGETLRQSHLWIAAVLYVFITWST
jgi:hypothetical protein